MKKIILLLSLSLFMGMGVRTFSQELPYQKGLEPVSLTPDELFVLSNIPELKLPEAFKGDNAPLLPISIDNSNKPYFRPITSQSGYECGQSSGIAFNFCYEIDRLRNLPANVIENQYPTHFTWNFLNNANNYQGVSFFDSWEIVKACGNMNVHDYGGALNTGGYTRWISGYDKYYNGMFNRINSVKAIRVDTPEGLLTLKYWLFNHLEEGSVGGVGNIYAQYFGAGTTLPPGTPEGGKYVQPDWGGSPSHGWTICGYNDSIRYDFNGDGQYTNNIDINGDGIVNMKDWEKGGVKFANGYAGTGWGNSGFCYTMYKNLADDIGNGGIWNHHVYVLDVKTTCTPKLTMKVTLKHNCRNKLKVTAGVSTDPGATVPSYRLEFPIFNFQGSSLYMQGGSTEADKTIEFGLDLAPLINQIESGQPAKYFLQVQEVDPPGTSSGEIVNWSLIDYTEAPPVITNYPSSYVPIQNNSMTRLGLVYTINVDKPVITTTSLPPAQLYQPYDQLLEADGGTAPYLWDARLDYPETSLTASFPAVTSQQLTLTNNNSGYAIKTLDFDFPFYKKFVNKLYIYADGYILFDDQPYTWPYLIDKMLLFKQTSILSPFMCDLNLYSSNNQGIWFEGNENYAIIRWKASIYNMQGSTNLNFAVKIYANGNIEYYYGDMIYPSGTSWTGGFSSGDNKNYQFSLFHNAPFIATNTLDKFTTCGYPPEMEITEEGHLTGVPTRAYQDLPIRFQVTDNDNLSTTKILTFSSFGLLVDQTVTSGGDSLIEFGETGLMSLLVSNVGTQNQNQVTFSVSETDPYITLADSTETLNMITGGQSLTLADAFAFNVSHNVPDNHTFTMLIQVQSQEIQFQKEVELVAHAPVLQITGTRFEDGDNGMPDPGETAGLEVTFKNTGSVKASAISVQLTSLDTNLTINAGTGTINILKPDSSQTLSFNATAGSSASFEYIYKLLSNLIASNNLTLNDTLYLFSGQIIEDFETGDMNKYPWYGTGQWPWFMEHGVKWEGLHSVRSGYITDNAESILNINARVLTAGEVSFYKYVSCEYDPSGNKNYDYLAFLIDGFEMGRWDGIIPWSMETYAVAPGYHTLSWVYHKDYSATGGWDGCILDFISLPLIEGTLPELSVTPLSFEKTLVTGQTAIDEISITNLGGGIMKYSVIPFDTTGNYPANTDNLTGSYIICSATGFTPGQEISWLFTVLNQSSDNEYIRDIKIDFPPGFVVTGATNFSGGSLGELTFQGTPGEGASLTWHGESAGGRGVIKPGEWAFSTITGTISESFMNDVFMVYNLTGDNIGGQPHTQSGNIKVTNSGLVNNWIALSNTFGSLMHNQTGTVSVEFDATELVPDTYHCDLIARDFYNNKVVIPVTLQVTFPVSVEDPDQQGKSRLSGNFPNPFSEETKIRFKLQEAGEVNLEIISLQGLSLRTWQFPEMPSGEQSVTWDGKDDQGNRVAPGVYTCRMKTGSYLGSLKLVMIR